LAVHADPGEGLAMNSSWLYAAAIVLAVWAAAHLFPLTIRGVVAGFGPITTDNKRVLTMEWIGEGLTLLFIAAILVGVAAAGGSGAARAVLWLTVVMLNVMSAVSLATGFRVHFIPYRLCPVVFSGSSLMVIAGLTI
jgi:hypothetical protein